MSQVPEQGLDVGFKYLQAFELSRDGLPEYIDYQEMLEAYKQSKLDHTAAYGNFVSNIRGQVNKHIANNSKVYIIKIKGLTWICSQQLLI